jgi:uncharacterized membrane protein HdeD (DUF308 family)
VFTVLALNWPFLVLRAAVAVVFGVAAIVLPTITLHSLVLLFGGYAATDGALAVVVALEARGMAGFGRLLFEAVVRLSAGLIAFVAPAVTALALPTIFAVWAIASGVTAIGVAVELRRELSGEWPLPVAGALSVITGVLLVMLPAAEPNWIFGAYALLFAFTLVALALRLRQLGLEIVNTFP